MVFRVIIDFHNTIVKTNKPIINDWRQRKIQIIKKHARDDYKTILKISDNVKDTIKNGTSNDGGKEEGN